MDFVILANAWGAGADNPTSKHRIALELARRGHRVLWVEGAGMRAPSVGSGSDRSRMVKKVLAALKGARRVAGVRVLSPLFIPMPKYRLIRALNGLIGAWSARVWCRLLGFKDPVLINYVPVLAEVMRWWSRGRSVQCSGFRVHADPPPSTLHPQPPLPAQVVYHCVDRWDAFKMYDSAVMAEMDRRCCEYADVVIASASELRDRCLRWNPNTHLVTHGVDFEHFAQASTSHLPPSPADLPPGPIIGFFGLLSEWVDQALLLRLAREIPGAQLVLIGKADVDVTALKGVGAIHLLGPRPFQSLPGYLARFTVGIIPFVVNDLTRSVNPIKLREMLSGGCPVVSTALPEVKVIEEGWGARGDCRRNGVCVAEDDGEFVRMVAGLVARPLSADERRAVSAGMAGETWAGKVDEMLKIIGRL